MSRRAIQWGWSQAQTMVVEAQGAGLARVGVAHDASSVDKSVRTKSTTFVRVRHGFVKKDARIWRMGEEKHPATAKTIAARIKRRDEWAKIREKERMQ